MNISSIGKTIAGVALASAVFVGASTPAQAALTRLSFGFIAIGSTVLNTVDITATTSLKTLPTSLIINTISPTTTAEAVIAGVALSGGVVLNSYAISLALGPVGLVVKAGNLTYTFTNEVLLTRTASGVSSAGVISMAMTGTITGDTSVGTPFLGQSASLSQSCTQVGIGAVVNCSDTLDTPNAITTPEPATMAILGVGMLGLAVSRRRTS